MSVSEKVVSFVSERARAQVEPAQLPVPFDAGGLGARVEPVAVPAAARHRVRVACADPTRAARRAGPSSAARSTRAATRARPGASRRAGGRPTGRDSATAGARYIIDCNATCGSCGCGGGGICAPGCYNCGCHCGSGSCDERLVCCNQFRYGQCHQELACVGPVVCRVASCRPPWEFDPTCTTASATANETALHTAPCLDDNATAFVSAFGTRAEARRADRATPIRPRRYRRDTERQGYWLVGSDGGVFTLRRRALPRLDRQPAAQASPSSASRRRRAARATGSSRPTAASSRSATRAFHGSTGGLRLNQPIVGMAPTPSGHGYWLVAADGGIFSFGDARFYGSTGELRLNQPIVGMARDADGQRLLARRRRRRHLQLRRRPLLRLHRGHPAQPTHRRHGARPRAARATGWSRPTAASSRSATRSYYGSLGATGGAKGRVFGMAPTPRGYWIASQR